VLTKKFTTSASPDHRARTRPEPQSGLLAWEFDQRTENSPREGRTVRTALVRT
jgi:hypothetical protein